MKKKLISVICILIVAGACIGGSLLLLNRKDGNVTPVTRPGKEIDPAILDAHTNLDDGEEEEDRNYTYQEGEFQLRGEQQFVLEDAQKYMDSVELGKTTMDDLAQMYGTNYKNKVEYRYLTTVEYPLYDIESFVRYGIRNSDHKVVEKTIMVYSSMDSNVQLSAELGTELESLEDVVDQLFDSMRFDEVVDILGDKYILMGETEYTKIYKWKDKLENGIQLVFTSDGILLEWTGVSKFF